MSNPMKVCLNMIVRNEAAIIERSLASAVGAIDSYVICDTGSDDDTVSRIRRFMEERGIDGLIHETAFRDFGSARNEALDVCRQSRFEFDYLLLADADMELQIADTRFRGSLSAPAYAVRQHNQISYYNTRLVRRDANARYVGMTHEYLHVDGPVRRLEALSFIDHACGSSRADKFERDVRLLMLELAHDPGNVRAMFYLAQTYRGQGLHREAIEWYRRRIAAGGWEEELWYARYAMALSFKYLGNGHSFLNSAREAFAYRPTRAEPLHAMARFYRDEGRFDEAMTLAELGQALPRPGQDMLFVHEEIYQHGFEEEISISGFYSAQASRREAARMACEQLSTRRDIPEHVRYTARQNWVHYALSAEALFGHCRIAPLEFNFEAPWVPFNPSVSRVMGTLEMLVRTSNYRIENGDYLCDDRPIQTRNYLTRLDTGPGPGALIEVLAPREPASLPGAPVVGYEDARLFEWRNRRTCVFNLRDRNPDWRCEMGVGVIADDGSMTVTVLRGYRDDVNQKNWVPLVGGDELFFIYSTDPFILLAWDGTGVPREILRTDPPLALDHLRGSSQAVALEEGGWLFLTHEAKNFGAQRVYLHRFVLLNEDFSTGGVSEAFYFESRCIEYVAGMAADGDDLLISFGTEDRCASLARIPLRQVLGKLRKTAG